jgi:glycosyltransferase involved in cell wall biosynthesis
MRTFAVIPAYNEAGRVGDVVRRACASVAGVVVVDDGSSDGTAEEARQAGASVVRHELNRGQGAALRTGTETALALGAEIVVHLDADGQHDPTRVAAVTAPIEAGEADVVFGSRFLGDRAVDMPASRRALLFCAKQFSALALGIPKSCTDPQSGLRALSADAARKVAFVQDRFAHCSEILRLVTRSPLRWKEVPTTVTYTRDSLKKGQKAADSLKIVWDLFLGSLQ